MPVCSAGTSELCNKPEKAERSQEDVGREINGSHLDPKREQRSNDGWKGTRDRFRHRTVTSHGEGCPQLEQGPRRTGFPCLSRGSWACSIFTGLLQKELSQRPDR